MQISSTEMQPDLLNCWMFGPNLNCVEAASQTKTVKNMHLKYVAIIQW